MKSHDSHVFMERLLPIAFRALPHQVWNPITELSKFFKDLCSTILRVDDLLLMEQNIIITTCKLERIFPPAFFNSMEHLPIHLPYEAKVGGPVQYRWMYPFERFLPSHPAANGIGDILKSHYTNPWPSWKQIPISTRDLWFGEFLTKLNGIPPTISELFRRTHQRKDKSWVDRKSEQVNEKFSRIFEELTQKANEEGTTPPNELDVWCDVARTKGGKIYGLGMESSVVAGRPYYRGSSSSSNEWVQRQELDELKKDLEEVKNERDELRVKVLNIEKLFEQNNAMIRQWMDSINRHSMPPSIEDSEDEDETQPPSQPFNPNRDDYFRRNKRM
ncbi:uncharacterized protein LOC109817593 isoform X2 [Cajanus cajan]|uniref:uncharacterized protein LOC109817593 isoform X2 n=1 Tax=Cajanus cajan TaxID=3821 RepID=UPI00098D8B95|nr:uncharacterized protein LOC109817593 isoform X2 [Cajanus cajan]